MCPHCNYSHNFTSLHATAYVCPQCHSILYKGISYTDNKPSETFRIEEDMSLFRIGTTLEYELSVYTFIGRFQFFLNRALRNKWILCNDKNDILYVIEQTGFYAVCKPTPVNLSADELSSLSLGSEFAIDNNNSFFLETLFKNTSTRIEGEIFEVEHHLEEFIAIDYSNERGDYAFAQIFNKTHNIICIGTCFGFDQLKLNNCRVSNE